MLHLIFNRFGNDPTKAQLYLPKIDLAFIASYLNSLENESKFLDDWDSKEIDYFPDINFEYDDLDSLMDLNLPKNRKCKFQKKKQD